MSSVPVTLRRPATYSARYKKAYDSMKACPLTFSHPSEAQQLDGIGPKICDRLTEKLKEHCEANGLPPPKKVKGKGRKRPSAEGLAEAEDQELAPVKKPRKPKPYVPSLRTGPYALILALSTLPEDSLQSLSKAQVIELAQPHCESSFTTPSEAGKFYTAWNSMTTLVNKDLVHERGRPQRKYTLTEEGWEVAKRIIAVRQDNGDSAPNSGKISVGLSKKVALPKTSKAHPTEEDGFLDLGEDSDPDSMLKPPPKSTSMSTLASTHERAQPTGQRLGSAPDDKFSTLPKSSNNQKPLAKPPDSHVVELLSSPEPSPVPDLPWSSSAFGQDFRSLTSKPKDHIPPPIHKPRPIKDPTPIESAPGLTSKPSSIKVPDLPTFSPLILQPGTYTVQLVLDNREVRTKDDRDYIADSLAQNGAKPLVRPLELGDFMWVAKLNDPNLLSRYGEEGDEIVLDWIVERKRLDDLVGSITDGRFQEQKFRLRKSGVKNVIYLIEEISMSTEKVQKFHEAINSAIASTQVVNGYFVKRTLKLDETIRYLARMTRMLKSIYEAKPLYLIPTLVLTPTTYLPLLEHLRSHPEHKERNYNITFPSFASLSSKSDTLTLRDVFLKMLMCTRGVSGDKALAIQKHWNTPKAFIEGFEACPTQKGREALVETKLGSMVGRAKIKGILGAKVAGVWGEK